MTASVFLFWEDCVDNIIITITIKIRLLYALINRKIVASIVCSIFDRSIMCINYQVYLLKRKETQFVLKTKLVNSIQRLNRNVLYMKND